MRWIGLFVVVGCGVDSTEPMDASSSCDLESLGFEAFPADTSVALTTDQIRVSIDDLAKDDWDFVVHVDGTEVEGGSQWLDDTSERIWLWPAELYPWPQGTQVDVHIEACGATRQLSSFTVGTFGETPQATALQGQIFEITQLYPADAGLEQLFGDVSLFLRVDQATDASYYGGVVQMDIVGGGWFDGLSSECETPAQTRASMDGISLSFDFTASDGMVAAATVDSILINGAADELKEGRGSWQMPMLLGYDSLCDSLDLDCVTCDSEWGSMCIVFEFEGAVGTVVDALPYVADADRDADCGTY